jgi:hypothetical protein
MLRNGFDAIILFLCATLIVTARVGQEEAIPQVFDDEDAIVKELEERMKPRNLVFDNNGKAEPHQFFHLHHMKTGGTSMDHVIQCGLSRAGTGAHPIPYYSLSECSQASYQNCINEPKARCRPSVESSAVMSYCAPLFQTNQLDWQDSDAITVIRNPVDRVWSMFRFETNSCYKCMELKDYYAHIDNGTVTGLYTSPDDAINCVAQLLNHQTRNLLTSPMSQDFTEEDQTEEALYNLRNRFTVVGLTEQLPLTAQMIGYSFPWLAEKVEGSSSECGLPHANASPTNNYCGPDRTHWDLPPHPDEETTRIIEEHNLQDMKLYEAAVQHFELQRRALGWGEETD